MALQHCELASRAISPAIASILELLVVRKGIQDYQIQALGRWTSTAYLTYSVHLYTIRIFVSSFQASHTSSCLIMAVFKVTIMPDFSVIQKRKKKTNKKEKKMQTLLTSPVASQVGSYHGFLSMKLLGVSTLLLWLGRDAGLLQSYPQH